MGGPKEAILGVTWRCNSRCRICDIWTRKGSRELLPEDYRALPSALRQVSLGGYGEPFLRKDLYKIVGVIREQCPKTRIVVVTNGLNPRGIVSQVKKMPQDVTIRVSLDGIGSIHDKVRGVPGAYDKATTTLSFLRKEGIRDLGVGLVINSVNDDVVEKVFNYSQENNLSFSCTIAQSSDLTFGKKDEHYPSPEKALQSIETIMGKLLAGFSPRGWATAYFLDGVRSRLKGDPRRVPCLAGKEFFYMDPSGNIYPCNVLAMKMGSLNNSHFPSLLDGNKKILDYIGQCPRQCWMTCTVTPSMRKRSLGPILWILRTRLFGISSLT